MENFKKLALVGMAGGMLLASQTPVNATSGDAVTTLAKGCGGGGGCSGQKSKNYTADASDTIQGQRHGCSGSAPQPSYNQSGCNASGQPQPTMVQQGCQARSYPQPQPSYSQSGCNGQGQPSHGCSAASNPNYSRANFQSPPQHGCSGMSPRIADAQPATQAKQLSETELLQQLDANGKAAYQRLSPEGKALAIKLAGQNTFRDKNEAIRAAEAASKNSMPKSNY